MNADSIALGAGVTLMAMERFALWPMVNPEAAFALGLGLAAVPAYRAFRGLIRQFGEG